MDFLDFLDFLVFLDFLDLPDFLLRVFPPIIREDDEDEVTGSLIPETFDEDEEDIPLPLVSSERLISPSSLVPNPPFILPAFFN